MNASTFRKLFLSLFAIVLSLTGAVAQTDKPRSGSADDFVKLGLALYQQGDLEGASRHFDQAIEIATRPFRNSDAPTRIRVVVPETARIYYNRAVTRYDMQDWDGARADLDEALALDPRFVMAWIKRGNILLSQGDWDGAIGDFSRAIQLDPRSVIARNNRGLAWQNKGNFDAALSDYNGALGLDPRLTVALNNRAGIRHDRGDLRGALDDYNKAIEIDPHLALLYCNRGVTRKAMGDLNGAIADYTQAILLKPDFHLAYLNRSGAWRTLGRGFEAEQDFIRSIGTGKQPDVSLEPPLVGVPAPKPAKP